MPQATATPTARSITTPVIFKSPTITPTNKPCTEVTGRILDLEIPTTHLRTPLSTKVYLPPCYKAGSGETYPVLYMFHGQAFMNDQWVNIGLTSTADMLISTHAIQPLIIVMPFEANWHVGPEESSFDEAILEDVIPYIDERYTSCGERHCRAIGGLSRGGNWAVYLGFAHPQLFSAVGAHSAPLFYGELGRITESVFRQVSLNDLPAIFIDVGNRDSEKQKVLDFVDKLNDLGVGYEFFQFEGRHEDSYWSAHTADYLTWYSSQLARE